MPKTYLGNAVIPTYVAEIVAKYPQHFGSEERALQRFSRAIAAMAVDTQDLDYERRAGEIERRARTLAPEELYAE